MIIIGARGVTMDQQQAPANQVTIFYSYAHADERLRQQLETHLGLLRQQGIIAEWHDRQIVAGTDWTREIDVHLANAAVILLLMSPDLLASDSCSGPAGTRIPRGKRLGSTASPATRTSLTRESRFRPARGAQP